MLTRHNRVCLRLRISSCNCSSRNNNPVVSKTINGQGHGHKGHVPRERVGIQRDVETLVIWFNKSFCLNSCIFPKDGVKSVFCWSVKSPSVCYLSTVSVNA